MRPRPAWSPIFITGRPKAFSTTLESNPCPTLLPPTKMIRGPSSRARRSSFSRCTPSIELHKRLSGNAKTDPISTASRTPVKLTSDVRNRFMSKLEINEVPCPFLIREADSSDHEINGPSQGAAAERKSKSMFFLPLKPLNSQEAGNPRHHRQVLPRQRQQGRTEHAPKIAARRIARSRSEEHPCQHDERHCHQPAQERREL